MTVVLPTIASMAAVLDQEIIWDALSANPVLYTLCTLCLAVQTKVGLRFIVGAGLANRTSSILQQHGWVRTCQTGAGIVTFQAILGATHAGKSYI